MKHIDTMQLKLFTPSGTVQSRKVTTQRSPRSNPSQTHWDLWTQPSESEQEMALLFLDIRNFTPLIGSFQASDIIHLVKKMLTAFQRIVRIHHGRIIETTGDGFYAAFGFNQTIDEAVNEAVASGDAILKYLDVMNATSFEKNLGRRIEAGIGIHSGKVATGRILLGDEEHLMVMGHPVNIASRLEHATKELNNNFVISASSFDLLTHKRVGMQTEINVKGVNERIAVQLIGNAYNC